MCITGRPALVLASAGSGKTRVLVARISWLVSQGVAPAQIMAVTFTNKAAEEMRERAAAAIGQEAAGQLTMGTFHAVLARVLRANAAEVGRSRSFTIHDPADALRTLERVMSQESRAMVEPGEVRQAIGRAKAELGDPELMGAFAGSEIESEIARAWRAYEQELSASDALDLDDLVGAAARLLERTPAIRQGLRRRFRHVLVDEVQDTNSAQLRVLRALCAERDSFFGVGDDAQAIYAFRGSHPRAVGEIADVFRRERIEVVSLGENYRSRPEVLSVAGAVLSQAEGLREKALSAQRPEGGVVEVRWWDTAEDEEQWVRAEVARLIDRGGVPASEIAILYRTRRIGSAMGVALAAAGIPYRMVGGQGFMERRVVRDGIAIGRLLVNPRDRAAWLRAAQTERGVGEGAAHAVLSLADRMPESDLLELAASELVDVRPGQHEGLRTFAEGLADIRRRLEPEEGAPLSPSKALAEAFLIPGGVVEILQQRARRGDDAAEGDLETLRQLLRMVKSYETDAEEEVDLGSWLEHAALVERESQGDDVAERVTLATIHSAKGLEWDAVFVVGVEEHTFPSHRAVSAVEQAEERRLAYVAFTRARERLVVSGAHKRDKARHGQSPFMHEAQAALGGAGTVRAAA